MISYSEFREAQQRAAAMLAEAGIALTPAERDSIEVADFGLGRLEEFGLQIVVYINTDRVCAKELVMFPGQVCPEHRHPPIGPDPGKEETFRCRTGEVYLMVPGYPTPEARAKPPADRSNYFTVWHEVVLGPGDQYTIEPNTPHWFQAGANGAIVSEFSTKSRDESDIFEDPSIVREPAFSSQSDQR